MKSKLTTFCLSLAVAITTVILFRLDSQRMLGSSTIEGTSLRCQILQSRSFANMAGSGATEIWFSVINSDGAWIQTQRIKMIGDGQTEWVRWAAPKTIKAEVRDTLTVIPIDLILSSGRTFKHDVVVGIN